MKDLEKLPEQTNLRQWPPAGIEWYYSDKWVAIACGDCREILPSLEKVDLAITSPPYNVGMDYGKWDDNMEHAKYVAFTNEWVSLCYSALKSGGRIAINIPNIGNSPNYGGKGTGILPFVPMVHESMVAAGLTVRECITWVKSFAKELEKSEESFWGGNTAWGSWLSPSNPFCRSFSEFIMVAHKIYPELQHKGKTDLTKEEFMLWSRNVWLMPTDNHQKHPAVFPEVLPLRLIKFYSYLGDTVLDPFCGTGTTVAIAKKFYRKCIGIEIEEKYCEIAARRCQQSVFEFDIPNDNIASEQQTML